MPRRLSLLCLLSLVLITAALGSGQKSPYAVDGLALGDRVRFESDAYKVYRCNPSEKFPGFMWCHKEKTEQTSHGEITFSNSILHSQDGTAVYVNHYIEPAYFGPNDIRSEIDRLSARFGEPAREIRMPRREGLSNAIMAVWGKLEFEPLDAADVATVASGGTHQGLLVSFLGDLQRSAKAGVPVYQLAGAATWNENGKGVLRFLARNPSQFSSAAVAVNKPSPQPPTADKAETLQLSCIGKLVNDSHGPHLVKIVDQWKTGVPAWPSRYCNAMIPSRISTNAESTCALKQPCQITGGVIKRENNPDAYWYLIFNMDIILE